MDKFIKIIANKLNLDLNSDTINSNILADGNTSDVIEVVKNKTSLVCKILNYQHCTTKLLFENEMYFYLNFYNKLSFINIPKLTYLHNIEPEKFIVLEKIEYYNCDFNNLHNIKLACDEILKLHIHFYEKKNLLNLNYKNNSEYIIEHAIFYDIKENLHILNKYLEPNLFLKISDLCNNVKLIYNTNERMTIIHGSFKSKNICFKKTNSIMTPYIIDWSLIKNGYAVEDILYLLIFSLDHTFFKENYLEILNYYYYEFNKHKYYRLDDYNEDILVSLKGFVLISIIGLFLINYVTKKNNNCFEYFKNYMFILEHYEEVNKNKHSLISYDVTEYYDIDSYYNYAYYSCIFFTFNISLASFLIYYLLL